MSIPAGRSKRSPPGWTGRNPARTGAFHSKPIGARTMETSKGFNLVEIVVAIGLFSLVGIIVLDAWVANGRLLRTGLGTVELQQEADAALERTSDAARNARAVLSSGFAGGATHSTSSSTFVLDLPGLLADGTASTTLTDIVK